MIDAQKVAYVLGLGRGVMTLRELRREVDDGLPVEALDAVVNHVTAGEREATELKYRIVPKTTLARRTRLSPEESQRLERLARMAALAETVWEDGDLAHEFLLSEQPQLGGERPVDLSRSDLGTREVETLLHAIEYSLPT